MGKIYIVNHSISGGSYVENYSSFHHTEAEAVASFEESKASAGEDPYLIELIVLDTETLDATTITGWEGSIEDYEE
jgi:hypothetical protein